MWWVRLLASMPWKTWLLYGVAFFIVSSLFPMQAHGLQCYACNVLVGKRYIDVGCSNPEVVTCSSLDNGFKHRFCLKTESTALGITFTSGCATSRHCHQQELPGVKIHCCDTDLCNRALPPRSHLVTCVCLLMGLLSLKWLL